MLTTRRLRRALLAGLCALALPAGAADVVLVNRDASGEGLNDPASRAPEDGNSGSTLGEQRRNALLLVANLIGSRLVSTVPIRVSVDFTPLPCSASSADLASGGAVMLVAEFDGPARPATFYPVALANAIATTDLTPERAHIRARFNSALDAPDRDDCLGGADWYYGLGDAPPDGAPSFISVAAHEMVHGLGFATYTRLEDDPDQPGSQAGTFMRDTEGRPLPDIYATLLYDLSLGAGWPALTPAQRAASATNTGNLVWNGALANAADGLEQGMTQRMIRIYAPAPLRRGASVSHWDAVLAPDALMEPFETGRYRVRSGLGLASCALAELGWTLAAGVTCPDNGPVDADAGFARLADSGGDVGGGGGGCSLGRGAPDPIWPALLLLAAWRAARRSP